MGGEQGAHRGAHCAGQGEGLVVVQLGESETAVLGVDLHAEGAELLQARDDLVGDACLALDAGGVDRGLAEGAQPVEELLAAPHALGVRERMRVDEVEPEAPEEEFLGETGLAPVPFPGGLRHLTGLALGDSFALGGGGGHEAHLTAKRMTGTVRYRPVLLDRWYPNRGDPTTPRASDRPKRDVFPSRGVPHPRRARGSLFCAGTAAGRHAAICDTSRFTEAITAETTAVVTRVPVMTIPTPMTNRPLESSDQS